MKPMTTLEILAFWHKVVRRNLGELEHDLSGRQQALLLHVYIRPGPHTVRSLSRELNISKPAVCRAVDMLSGMNLLKRKKDEEDRRNVFIQRTIQGSVFLSDLSDILMQEMELLAGQEIVPA